LIVFHELFNAVKFGWREPKAALQPNRFEPKLGLAFISFNMNMRWFCAIGRIKKNR
jgi:hypothetical protein